MNWMEVALLILGVGAFVASFVLPEKKGSADELNIDSEILQKLIAKEIEEAKTRVSEVVDETLDYAVEKTERASERISNEKIMAISDYSETVLSDINKAHQEVIFLYDMLNDKHKNLKETVKQVDKQAKEAEEKANAAAATLAAKEEASAILQENIQKQVQAAAPKAVLEVSKAVPEVPKTVPEAPVHAEIVKKEEVESGKKNVEVYSFVQKAPHIERTAAKQSQAENMVNTVTKIKEKQEAEAAGKQKKAEKPVEKENNNDKILRLYKTGMDSVEIAKELGLGVGEVKLVINLFKGAV